MLNVETSIAIETTADKAWAVLKDLGGFKRWNTRTDFRLDDGQDVAVGDALTMRVNLFGLWLKVPVKIQRYEESMGLRWIGGIPGIYTGSHYFYFKEHDGETVFIQGEDFKGLFVPLMWPFLKKELTTLYDGGNESFAEYVRNPD